MWIQNITEVVKVLHKELSIFSINKNHKGTKSRVISTVLHYMIPYEIFAASYMENVFCLKTCIIVQFILWIVLSLLKSL